MPLDWGPFVDVVRRHSSFVLTTHVRPDGDGLGSMLALADVLRHLGKSVQMTVASILPDRYRFLDPAGRVVPFEPPGDAFRAARAAVVLDTGTWNQLGAFGPFLRDLPATKVVIDHHLTQDDLGATRFVDTSAEATGRLVHEAIAALGVPLSPPAANHLFIAVATDTGWFRHSNVQPRTFALAAQLMEAGAQPTVLYEQLYENNSLARYRLLGLVLERLQTACAGRVAYMVLHRDDYERTGALPPDSEELINYARSLAGVEVAVFFMEQPRGGVKVSFRSRATVDVARVAEQFGGGGHARASGATLETSLDDARARVLHAVEAALGGPC